MSHALNSISRYYNIKPSGILHIGANKGQEVSAYRDSGIRPVILVEALEEPYNHLVRAIDGERGFFPVQACLSDQAGKEVTFYIASNGGQSSSYYEPGRHLELYPHVKFESKQVLLTSTVDAVLSNLSERIDIGLIDYISLDTQGSELDILRGASGLLRNARFIYTEVSFEGVYKNAPSLYDVIDYMQSQGFDICQLLMRNKGWGDALFVAKGAIGNL